MSKEIPLTPHGRAIVDAEDFEWLSKFKWSAHGNGYAARRIRLSGKDIRILMHREILGLNRGDLLVDHRDGNTLNNTRANLRLATPSQNQRNCGKRSNNTSGYKGVSKRRRRWLAQIVLHKKKYHLGVFSSPIDAAFVYDVTALRLHGEFARTNFFSGSVK